MSLKLLTLAKIILENLRSHIHVLIEDAPPCEQFFEVYEVLAPTVLRQDVSEPRLFGAEIFWSRDVRAPAF